MQQSIGYNRGAGINNAIRFGLKTLLYATSSLLCPAPSTSAFSITSRSLAHDNRHNATFTGESTISLAHLASSPERFASSMNMSVKQVDAAINARKLASVKLNEQLIAIEEENRDNMTAAEIGRRKHQLICEHRFNHFRNAFVCRKCWTFTPICVCHLFEERNGRGDNDQADKRIPLPKGVKKLIVWTHHDEYGRTSNTGSLLPLGLQQTDILMKGLLEHEQIMDDILTRKDLTPIVLWPDKKNKRISATITELNRTIAEIPSCSNDVVSDNLSSSNRGIVLIAIEGTWNTARKMVNKLPPHVQCLDLSEEIRFNFTMPEFNEGIFFDSVPPASDALQTPYAPSLLAPLRRQGKGAKQDCVSTLEATVVALLALGMSVDDASFLLNCARTKVKRIREYTGKIYQRD